MPTIKIHNVATDEIIEREMNENELAQYKLDQEQAELAATQKAAAQERKDALLAKLGITEEEAKLLLS